MRVETREAAATDVRARLDPELEPGDAARALRWEGGTIAWPAETPDEVRAVVEGTAYGAYDPGLYQQRYSERPELTLVVDAPAELHPLVRRQDVVARHFLHEFAGDGAWAHFDLSPAYIERRRPDYALDQGGTGYGVRLIVELAEERAT